MIDDPLNRTKARRGTQCHNAKLTDSDVRLIRQLVEERESLKRQLKTLTNAAIAEKFDVHQKTIDKVTCGESWWHVA